MLNFLRGCADLVNGTFAAMSRTPYFRYILALSVIMICYGFFCFLSRSTRKL